ncbi:MAG: hypothetical protein ABUL62_23510 [Myxococcales bacterium]
MTRSFGTGFGFLGLLLAVEGCSVASAADGPATSSTSVLGAPAATTPPSYTADGPPHGKPPQEAFDACKSHSEGDACSVSFDGHTMTGTCRKGPNGESDLACAPAHPPGPPPSQNSTLSGSALERKLDRLERDIHAS